MSLETFFAKIVRLIQLKLRVRPPVPNPGTPAPDVPNLGTLGAVPFPSFCNPADGNPHRGYGVANAWPTIDPVAHAAALAANGFEIDLIEVSGWGDGAALDDMSKIFEPLHDKVAANRAMKIVTILCGSNDNSGKKKYGSKRETLDHYMGELSKLAAFIAGQIGPDGIVLQPSTECQTAGGLELERIFRAKCPESLYSYAWNPNSTEKCPGAYKWRIVHPSSTSTTQVSTGQFIVTDHGTLLAKLSDSGAMSTKFNPAKAAAYVAACEAKNQTVVLYGFCHDKIDYATLAACAGAK